MLANNLTGELAGERMAEFHRQAEHQRLIRLARAQRRSGASGVRRGWRWRWLAGWRRSSGAGAMVEPSTAPATARPSATP
jgi:hypothetical protein